MRKLFIISIILISCLFVAGFLISYFLISPTVKAQTAPLCGNNVTEPGEACDGTDLNNYTCSTVAAGFKSGTLSCKTDCSGYDVTQCVQGNTINALSCNQSDVQAAIDSATDGDTVLVPEGNCVWTSRNGDGSRCGDASVCIDDKNIILMGAGIDKTIINDSTDDG